jgi:hypothetical protein
MKRRFLFLLMAAFTFVGANASINRANNYLKVNATTATAGKTVELDLIMKNAKEITTWQTTFVLPEGITLVSATAADRWTEAVTVSENTVFSETETAVAAGEGVVAKVVLNVDASVVAGDYSIQLFPMKMVATDAIIEQIESHTFTLTVEEGVEPGKEGDLNGDGFVDPSDIQVILNDMADSLNTPAFDLNKDGYVDPSDIQVILNIMAES